MNENGNNITPGNGSVPELNNGNAYVSPKPSAADGVNRQPVAPVIGTPVAAQQEATHVQANPVPKQEPRVAYNPYAAQGTPATAYARQTPGYAAQPAPTKPATPVAPVAPVASSAAPVAASSNEATLPGNGATKKKQKTKKSKDDKKNGNTKGFFVFMIVAIVVSVLAIVLCIFLASRGNEVLTPELPSHVPGSDDTQLTITASPTPDENSQSLTTIQIAESAEKINVGIMIYEKSNSFISNTTTSLIGEGSGIVMGVDKSGKFTYILTCAHVISDAVNPGYTMTVQDSDGNTYDGIMVGCDVKTDIGVIKIEATGLTEAQFGDSSVLKKGQRVYAIGNPGGMEFFGSFTDGMVSSIDRPISSEGGYEMECIQHTTPINSGNSGGALLNEYGQVIGINSSKIVSTGYEGMAFAIPISDAKPIIDDLIAHGYVTNRPKLGISYTPAMQYQQYAMIIQINDLPAGSLIIRDINPDSALASTDAEVYDLIIAVDGEPLDTADVLLDKIENGKVGDELTLTLCRVDDDYSVKKFDVKIKLVADTGSATANRGNSSNNNYWDENFGN